MWTVQEIENVMTELAMQLNLEFNTPIKINSRLTKTLGRVMSEPTLDGYIPNCIEFSKRFLETSTDESVRQTIMHEFAHWAALVQTGHPHGHDALFKAICRSIGCTADKAHARIERTVDVDSLYKYVVKCSECGNTMHYSRAGNVVKYPHWYTCGRCGGDSLEVIQNW